MAKQKIHSVCLSRPRVDRMRQNDVWQCGGAYAVRMCRWVQYIATWIRHWCCQKCARYDVIFNIRTSWPTFRCEIETGRSNTNASFVFFFFSEIVNTVFSLHSKRPATNYTAGQQHFTFFSGIRMLLETICFHMNDMKYRIIYRNVADFMNIYRY